MTQKKENRGWRAPAQCHTRPRPDLQATPRIDEILWRLGQALKSGRLSEWESGFARGLLGQAKRGGPRWRPSGKQLAVIDRILAEIRQPETTDDPLIDEEAA